MSDTTGDVSDLCRRLGIRDMPVHLQESILKALDKLPKSIWLFSSKREACEKHELVVKCLEGNELSDH
ncbi:hypothetical protein [Clostridium sp.]